ncbi:hypothetical protein [Dysgonomonas sp. GY617]|uniref:hypothetical protein n=1 Tax=Dysgonomonas sp. GY617 TaxID=2780420 RepID=UPI001883505E|nr:hypothetical protein [Dysgonomonas sp. GY617]MBF0574414.1 hypothetical protein [Dysgonomonas sp. GY617]
MGNSVGALVSGGNIGKSLASGFQDSQTGAGVVGIIRQSQHSKSDSLPEYSSEEPGVYTYSDGSYAYTVDVDGRVTYQPSELTNAVDFVQSDNGALLSIPGSLSGKQKYIQTLLDSYGDPLGVDKASMTMSEMNNFVSSSEPLSGAQQSNLLALDVVNKSPEALAYTSQALAQTTGKPAVDWIAILTGLWNTAKKANIPGVSNALIKAEDQAVGVVTDIAEETAVQKIARIVRNYGIWIFGGVILLFALLLTSKRR